MKDKLTVYWVAASSPVIQFHTGPVGSFSMSSGLIGMQLQRLEAEIRRSARSWMACIFLE